MALLLSDRELDRVKRRIEDSIRSSIEDTGTRGGVVALSGGVDSALVAKLASEAIGDRLFALILPEEGVTLPEDIEHAEQLAKELGIGYKLIKIDDVLKGFSDIYTTLHVGERKRRQLSWANVKPRVRMILSYMVANLDDRVVLGTGNKTEILLGYFTKYGDGGVDLLPIGDLYKTQVIQMARYLDLPEEIVEKPPSAGLWQGQTDEAELGATYEEIDDVLYCLVEGGLSPEKAASKLKIEITLVNRIYDRMKRNEHKRRPPVITKLF
ncbi:MAG: NAD+ synthase [Candidatus Hydrothermarchaeales archaeon]